MKIGLFFLAAVLILTGCSCTPNGSSVSSPSPSASPSALPSSSPAAAYKEAKDVVGEESSFGTPVVSLKMSEGKIVEIDIDEINDAGSKKEMGEEYKMSENAIAPWYKQIEALEKYIVENGVESIELNEGKAVNEDLVSSVTISIENYIKTINKAVNEAK